MCVCVVGACVGRGVAASAVVCVTASTAAAVAAGSGASVAASTVKCAGACCALRLRWERWRVRQRAWRRARWRERRQGALQRRREQCRGWRRAWRRGRGDALRWQWERWSWRVRRRAQRRALRRGRCQRVTCSMPPGQCGARAEVVVQVRRGGGGVARCEVLDRDVCGRRVLRACDASCGRVRWAWCAGSASCVVAGPESGRGRQCRRFAGPPARPGGL